MRFRNIEIQQSLWYCYLKMFCVCTSGQVYEFFFKKYFKGGLSVRMTWLFLNALELFSP